MASRRRNRRIADRTAEPKVLRSFTFKECRYRLVI